jgi:hypothetical protein
MEAVFPYRDDDPSSRRVRLDGLDDERVPNPRPDPRPERGHRRDVPNLHVSRKLEGDALHIGVLARARDF